MPIGVVVLSKRKIVANGDDPIPINKDSYSLEIFKVKNELIFSFVDALLHTDTPYFF